MDFRITDAEADPPGVSEGLHSEKLVRLDRCYCCYQPPERLPPPGPPPVLRAGTITFGSFHRPKKLSAELIHLWSTIMHQAPCSRILFHHVFGGARHVSKEFREPILSAFSQYGIVSSRVLFTGARPLEEHLATIARADLALDAIPYNGMTITCESLAMGVPVVTLAGLSHVSRVGVSLLKACGMEEWIADTAEQYVSTAVSWAGRVQELSKLRADLPHRIRASPLTNAHSYVRALESAYRACCGRV